MTGFLRLTRHNKPTKKGPAILFVCTANICRSPMAAALFQERLKQERTDWQDWLIESAGTWAREGEGAASNSKLVMEQRGLDISDHRARTVTPSMLRLYDLILTMEPGQKEALQVEFPMVAKRVFMLSEMEGSMTPISDPYGGPLEGYQKTAEKLEQIFANGMQRIYALVEHKFLDHNVDQKTEEQKGA